MFVVGWSGVSSESTHILKRRILEMEKFHFNEVIEENTYIDYWNLLKYERYKLKKSES
jgi:hypothetical protein